MKSKKIFFSGVGVICLIIVAIFIFNRSKQVIQPKDEKPSSNIFSIVLNDQNESGEAGLATFEEKDGKTVIRIKLVNAPVDVSQPAHIYKGSCEKPVSELFDINNVVNGESETTIDDTLKNVLAKAPFILNVHKSAEEDNIYVSCGIVANNN